MMDAAGEAYHFCFIFNPRLTALEFLRVLARELLIEQPALRKDELLGQIHTALYRYAENDICPVLVIDEAQLLPDRGESVRPDQSRPAREQDDGVPGCSVPGLS